MTNRHEITDYRLTFNAAYEDYPFGEVSGETAREQSKNRLLKGGWYFVHNARPHQCKRKRTPSRHGSL